MHGSVCIVLFIDLMYLLLLKNISVPNGILLLPLNFRKTGFKVFASRINIYTLLEIRRLKHFALSVVTCGGRL